MATIVNDGLSPALFAAIKRVQGEYKRAGYLSTTSCIEPPRIRVLGQRHDQQIVIPASTLVPSFIGTCVHKEIDRYGKVLEIDGEQTEKEFIIDISGIKFSCKADWYTTHNKEVGDYKVTPVWSYTFNPNGKPEHIQQININAYMARANGYSCDNGWIEMIFNDWKLSAARHDSKYPPRVQKISMFKLWDDKEAKAFIEDRISLHLKAEKDPDDTLLSCTSKEQWRKDHVWAVIKKGNKKAVRGGLCTTESEAKELVKKLGSGHRIDERHGERTRCEYYCNVQQWCNQYKEEGSERS
jgi:hypothetical protein